MERNKNNTRLIFIEIIKIRETSRKEAGRRARERERVMAKSKKKQDGAREREEKEIEKKSIS